MLTVEEANYLQQLIGDENRAAQQVSRHGR
jgi:hypothetical protein